MTVVLFYSQEGSQGSDRKHLTFYGPKLVGGGIRRTQTRPNKNLLSRVWEGPGARGEPGHSWR